MKATHKPKKQGKKKRSKERDVFIGFHGSKEIAEALAEIARREDRSTASVLRRIVGEKIDEQRISDSRIQIEKLPKDDKK